MPMTAVGISQPVKMRARPATSRHTGTMSASCGLTTITLSATPASQSRSRAASHQHAATAAPTSATGCPTMTPNATGNRPANIAANAALVRRSPGALRNHASAAAARIRTVHARIAAPNGSAVSGVTSHTSGGGLMNGE